MSETAILYPDVHLQHGKEKGLLRGHPWVFSGAIHKIEVDDAPPAAGRLGEGIGRQRKRPRMGPLGRRIDRSADLDTGHHGPATGERLVDSAVQRLLTGAGGHGHVLDR